MKLCQWYRETGSKLKATPVDLCTTSISLLKKLEYAKKILHKGKKKNPKYCDSWAAKKAGISRSSFCRYLREFRNSTPNPRYRRWIREEAIKELNILIQKNGGVEKMGMRSEVADRLHLHRSQFSRHLYTVGMPLQKHHSKGDKSHFIEALNQLNILIEKNDGVETRGMRAQVADSLKLPRTAFSKCLISMNMVSPHSRHQ